jgi:DNA-binding NarL/FixJ family response regulator
MPNPYHPDATPWNEADGIAWSESSTRDLIAALEQGDSIEEIANYLQYSKETVRAKIGELGLKERRT